MYNFALNLVPKLARLCPRNQTRAQVYILTYLSDLEEEQQNMQQSHTTTQPFTSSQQPVQDFINTIQPFLCLKATLSNCTHITQPNQHLLLQGLANNIVNLWKTLLHQYINIFNTFTLLSNISVCQSSFSVSLLCCKPNICDCTVIHCNCLILIRLCLQFLVLPCYYNLKIFGGKKLVYVIFINLHLKGHLKMYYILLLQYADICTVCK